jgi:hypothetical protein
MDKELFMKKFHLAREVCEEAGIYIMGNDGNVCMPMMFATGDIINFLNREEGNGLQRLQELAKILNQEGLVGVDFHGQKVKEWVNQNEALFEDIKNEDHKGRIMSDCCVYVNHYGKEENKGHNEYVKDSYKDLEVCKANKYKDGLLWFWCGEY